MASFNKVLLMGNLTRDPQLRYLPNSQTAICEFGIASNRKYKTSSGEEREEVLFVDCTAWGRQGEVINQWCTKGKPIFVEGHLKLDTWEDKSGGGKRSKISVVVDNFQFIGGRDDAGGAGGGGGARESYARGGGGGGSGSGSGSGGGGGDEYDQRPRGASRGAAPQPAAAGRQAAEQPFDDQEQFGEEDIPF
jgi:single-strand DNA-binding protein